MTNSTRASLLVLAATASHVLGHPAFAQSTRSPIDIQREEAAAAFGPRLAALSMMSAQAAADRHRYDVACKNKTTIIQPKPVPGIPLDRPLIGQGAIAALGTLPPLASFPEKLELKNETTATCRILWDDVAIRSALIADELSRIDEGARRRGTLPGIMRDLKASYGFDPVISFVRP